MNNKLTTPRDINAPQAFIPAEPGYRLIDEDTVAWCLRAGHQGDIESFALRPIIAWCVSRIGVKAITDDAMHLAASASDIQTILRPDGRVFNEDDTWPSLDSFIAENYEKFSDHPISGG